MTKINLKLSRFLSALVVVLLVFGAWTQELLAEEAQCSVFEIEAKNGTEGMDGDLKALEGKLKKPPFSAWNEFKLVKKHEVLAPKMTAISVALAGGGKLGLLYKERNDSKKRKSRLRIAMTLDNADGKRKADITYKVDSGDFNLLGQNAGKDGASKILAIRCTVK